ncbi:MAG: LuxR C-terminal-related transcriptional regulator [Rectinemataceae bacterium]
MGDAKLSTEPTWRIIDSIQRVLEGQHALSPDVAAGILEHSLGKPSSLESEEIDVLECVFAGMMNKEIAAKLRVSLSTVER